MTTAYIDPILNYKDYKIRDHVLTTYRRNLHLVNKVIKVISPQLSINQILNDSSNWLKYFRIK